MRGLIVSCLLIALGGGAQAEPQGKQRAKEAYRAGLRHYNLSEFAEALTSFKEAYRNYEEPTFLFNIGQCQRQLGQKLDAVRSYRAYLRETPAAPNRAEVESLIAGLENAIRQEQTTTFQPPRGTIETPEPRSTEPVTVVTPAPAPTAERKPLYKKWWLWTAVGAVVVVGVGVGVGVGLSQSSPDYPHFTPTDGRFTF